MFQTFIIYLRDYDADLRMHLVDKYKTVTEHDCDLVNEWSEKFNNLSFRQLDQAKTIFCCYNY